MKMEFFGYTIEINATEAGDLERAKEVLKKHGFRAVKMTSDLTKKRASAGKATEARQRATAEKIQNGMNLWRMEASEKPLTAYKLAKLADVSQNTAKKYLTKINAL